MTEKLPEFFIRKTGSVTMKKFFSLFGGLLALLTLAGCADPVVFAEVFQLQQDQKLYTRYNIWYEDPENISCLNIQRGTFLPIGTEIEPVKTTAFPETIVFKEVKTRKEFTIHFRESYRLCTMRDFIADTFTTESLDEQLKGVSPKARDRILRGEVMPGMTQKEVILSYGPPSRLRTPSLQNETWFYWLSDSQTVRLVFRGDKVRRILHLDNEL